MAYADMKAELRGSLPKLSPAYVERLINRAWRNIRLSNLWSFNMFEASIITPPAIITGNSGGGQPTATGTVTVTQGLPQIQFDAAAIAAINQNQAASPYSLITQRQFRVLVGGIYNIISYDPVTGAAVLDRMYGDPSGTQQPFQIYQCYYTVIQDFLTWVSIRNPVMFYSLNTLLTRESIDRADPQRTVYTFPRAFVPWGVDTRGQGTQTPSSTLGWPMWEMWGQPINPFVYQAYGVRQGSDLVNDEDTLPFAVAEETVLARARMYAYEWAEANKDMAPRNTGPDFKFLYGAAKDEFKQCRVRDAKNDREFLTNWFTIRDIPGGPQAFYNTYTGVASTLGDWGGDGW